jgi:Spy/CpxP family protein refolding chaperone
MKPFRNKFAAWTAVAVLGAATSLFAAETSPGTSPNNGHRHGRYAGLLSSLNLTPAQQAQEKAIFQDARQSAQPLHQQLRQTRQALRAAVESNNTAQIQQLASTQGSELGQLMAIRSTAMAKVYQTLTPDQQQHLAALRAARHAKHPAPAAAQN